MTFLTTADTDNTYLNKPNQVGKIFNRLLFLGNQRDHENRTIQPLAVIIFHKLKQNRKTDDDDAVHKLCSESSLSADC